MKVFKVKHYNQIDNLYNIPCVFHVKKYHGLSITISQYQMNI